MNMLKLPLFLWLAVLSVLGLDSNIYPLHIKFDIKEISRDFCIDGCENSIFVSIDSQALCESKLTVNKQNNTYPSSFRCYIPVYIPIDGCSHLSIDVETKSFTSGRKEKHKFPIVPLSVLFKNKRVNVYSGKMKMSVIGMGFYPTSTSKRPVYKLLTKKDYDNPECKGFRKMFDWKCPDKKLACIPLKNEAKNDLKKVFKSLFDFEYNESANQYNIDYKLHNKDNEHFILISANHKNRKESLDKSEIYSLLMPNIMYKLYAVESLNSYSVMDFSNDFITLSDQIDPKEVEKDELQTFLNLSRKTFIVTGFGLMCFSIILIGLIAVVSFIRRREKTAKDHLSTYSKFIDEVNYEKKMGSAKTI